MLLISHTRGLLTGAMAISRTSCQRRRYGGKMEMGWISRGGCWTDPALSIQINRFTVPAWQMLTNHLGWKNWAMDWQEIVQMHFCPPGLLREYAQGCFWIPTNELCIRPIIPHTAGYERNSPKPKCASTQRIIQRRQSLVCSSVSREFRNNSMASGASYTIRWYATHKYIAGIAVACKRSWTFYSHEYFTLGK